MIITELYQKNPNNNEIIKLKYIDNYWVIKNYNSANIFFTIIKNINSTKIINIAYCLNYGNKI